MTREEAIKKFDFDMRFRYCNGIYFHITKHSELEFIYKYIIDELKLSTNDAYIDFQLSYDSSIKISCIVYINISKKQSDAYAYNFGKYKMDNIFSLISLPEYLRNVL